jgi:spore coat protein U-like protein
LLCSVSKPAFAATSTASFGVSATVQAACQASTPVIAFGNYATAGGAPVSVTCTNPTPYKVSLSADLTAPPATKTTEAGKVLLDYALLPASSSGQKPTAGSAPAYTASGQTARAWHVSSGAFADVVTVTITY